MKLIFLLSTFVVAYAVVEIPILKVTNIRQKLTQAGKILLAIIHGDRCPKTIEGQKIFTLQKHHFHLVHLIESFRSLARLPSL